jgi:hypothetical protein
MGNRYKTENTIEFSKTRITIYITKTIYDAIEKIKDAKPERYAMIKKRFDGESLFYRFCKLAFYPNNYEREELAYEARYFKAAGEAVETKVWFNTFDHFGLLPKYLLCNIATNLTILKHNKI